jgi:redox-regulated HSP33 family molecular chaperone
VTPGCGTESGGRTLGSWNTGALDTDMTQRLADFRNYWMVSRQIPTAVWIIMIT